MAFSQLILNVVFSPFNVDDHPSKIR